MGAIRPRVFALSALPEAMAAAAQAGNLEYVVVRPEASPRDDAQRFPRKGHAQTKKEAAISRQRP